jgi:mono/diheme cytochrome c family protein
VGTSGASPIGDAPPFRIFAQLWPLEYLDEALAEGIMVGHREHEMPVFHFEVQEIADLSAYLEELNESLDDSE